jgi:hypothetical protein
VSFFGNRDRDLEDECSRYADRQVRETAPDTLSHRKAAIVRLNGAQKRLRRLQNAVYDAALDGRDSTFLVRRRDQEAQNAHELKALVEQLERDLDELWHLFFERCYRGKLRPV